MQSSWSKKYYLYVHEPKCLPSLWIHRKGHHKWLLIMSQIFFFCLHINQRKCQDKEGRQDTLQPWTKHVDAPAYKTHLSHKNIYVFLSSCQKWKPSPNECSISSLPFYCPMLFRITQESYTMVFGPKQHWIGVGGWEGFLPFSV